LYLWIEFHIYFILQRKIIKYPDILTLLETLVSISNIFIRNYLNYILFCVTKLLHSWSDTKWKFEQSK